MEYRWSQWDRVRVAAVSDPNYLQAGTVTFNVPGNNDPHTNVSLDNGEDILLPENELEPE
jgi:hypothetical protein